MTALTVTQARQLLNEQLSRPISKQAFYFSLLPVVLAAGDAQRLGPHAIVIDGDAWRGYWLGYLAYRERQIAAGHWSSSRPYSAEEAELWQDGAYDVQAGIVPAKENACV